MAIQNKTGRQNAANAGESAALDKGPPQEQKVSKLPGKSTQNQHREDQHGSGEGQTGMQPGAGHPRGR